MNWCIFYCRNDDPMNWHTMRLKRSDGVLVSAKTPKETYNCKVKRVCRARNDAFYLAGN